MLTLCELREQLRTLGGGSEADLRSLMALLTSPFDADGTGDAGGEAMAVGDEEERVVTFAKFERFVHRVASGVGRAGADAADARSQDDGRESRQ